MLILAAWALLFAPQLFRGQTFVLGDASVFRPFAELSRSRWLELHERTFWNPYVFMGIPAAPSLADPRPQYLPDLLIDLYERLRLPRHCPLAGPLLAHLAGMLAAASLAGGLWSVGVAGMLVAALAWGLMPGLLIPFSFGHDAQFVSTSLIPVVLLCVHVTMTSPGRGAQAGALALALVTGFQCLTGHPQFIVYSGALAVAFAAAEALWLGRPQPLRFVAPALVLGAAIAAAMWWPALLYSLRSFRGVGAAALSLDEVGKFSLSWRDLASLLWPRAVGFGGETYWGGMKGTDYSPYLGVTLLAMAAGRSTLRGAGRSTMARFLGIVSLASVLVSLGATLGPLYGFLHAHVPFWSRFRVPFYVLVAAQLGLALLAARAFAPATEAPAEGTRGRVVRISVLAAGVVALAIGVGLALGPLTGAYGEWARGARPGMAPGTAIRAAKSAGEDLVLRLALLAGTLTLLGPLRRRSRAALAASGALGVLVALDLGSVGVPFLLRATGAPERISPPPAPLVARVTARDPWARALSVRRPIVTPHGNVGYDETYTNYWISWRARSLAGTHGAVPGIWRPVVVTQLTRYHPVLRAFGVVYFACDSQATLDPALFERVSPIGAEPVYRLKRALGRAYAVPMVVALQNDDEMVGMMSDRSFEPALVAVTADPSAAGRYPGSPQCQIRWLQDEPDRIALQTRSPAPAFLVVADTYFPGWEARLDGSEVPIFRVDQLNRGVVVPAGVHQVSMSFVPEGWVPAMWLTRAALAVWCALALGLAAPWRPRRRATRPETR